MTLIGHGEYETSSKKQAIAGLSVAFKNGKEIFFSKIFRLLESLYRMRTLMIFSCFSGGQIDKVMKNNIYDLEEIAYPVLMDSAFLTPATALNVNFKQYFDYINATNNLEWAPEYKKAVDLFGIKKNKKLLENNCLIKYPRTSLWLPVRDIDTIKIISSIEALTKKKIIVAQTVKELCLNTCYIPATIYLKGDLSDFGVLPYVKESKNAVNISVTYFIKKVVVDTSIDLKTFIMLFFPSSFMGQLEQGYEILIKELIIAGRTYSKVALWFGAMKKGFEQELHNYCAYGYQESGRDPVITILKSVTKDSRGFIVTWHLDDREENSFINKYGSFWEKGHLNKNAEDFAKENCQKYDLQNLEKGIGELRGKNIPALQDLRQKKFEIEQKDTVNYALELAALLF